MLFARALTVTQESPPAGAVRRDTAAWLPVNRTTRVPSSLSCPGLGEPVIDADKFHSLRKAVEDLQNLVGGAPQTQPAGSPSDAKKGKSLKEDTDDVSGGVGRGRGRQHGTDGRDAMEGDG